ncbi:uncharacterized protein A1O5_05849 [Cladophialophora psammophila CBS 110553]|uniref:Heterokaryon incompatibility domain-containing protein n=1 Tax=Cladophialophora psammophila CBS 110553 TaxID=1182543 RepID=W9WSH5_9EURO|nr:uncharacterized protein A1O5_05849 [Cladophialophora psammophila CBS 110553]EXJ70858.1 hypothetical protein A1O5_05849 [Cladophialophora psammophila CBS 110553]
MWIIQEFVMARKGFMTLGQSVVDHDLSTLAKLIDISESLGFGETNRRRGPGYSDEEKLAAKNTSETYGKIYAWRQLMHEDRKQINFLTAIPVTMRYQMTNPVDRYYALLGICGQDRSSDPRLAVSYSEPEADVQRRFTRHMIEESCRDAVILIANCGGQRPEFSSWCPDWSRGNHAPVPVAVSMEDGAHTAPTTTTDCCQHEFLYHAGGRSLPDIKFSNDGNCLILRGSQVDEVDNGVGTPFSTTWRLEAEPTRNRLLKDWHDGTLEALRRYFDISILSGKPFGIRHPCIAAYKDGFARAVTGATPEQCNSPVVYGALGFEYAVLKEGEDGGNYFSPSPLRLNFSISRVKSRNSVGCIRLAYHHACARWRSCFGDKSRGSGKYCDVGFGCLATAFILDPV